MFKWLSYGQGARFDLCASVPSHPPPTADPESENPLVDKDFFMKREFSFTMQDDIYIRYLSFKDEAEMKSWIQKKQPHKIDIGAVYTSTVSLFSPPKESRY
jgi:DNA primase small subunit